MGGDPRIIVALDFSSASAAQSLVDRLSPELCRLKVGKELFVRGGPQFVKSLVQQGYGVFLDLKFHDIPNTVAQACKAAADLGVWMLNVHALGGIKMMTAAREAINDCNHCPLLIAVTILTSLDDDDLVEIGLHGSAQANVLRLAALAEQAGLDGVVCSPLEVNALRKQRGESFKLVTPGIRPLSSSDNDQQRIMTPSKAINAGSDYLVIGRPITQSPDPLASLQGIIGEISQ